jgi:hypothetical protein
MAKNEKYDDRDRGALFRNSKKESDNQPDYTGSLNVNGSDFWISGWINTSKAGSKYMSLAIRSKDAPTDRKSGKADKVDQTNASFGLG